MSSTIENTFSKAELFFLAAETDARHIRQQLTKFHEALLKENRFNNNALIDYQHLLYSVLSTGAIGQQYEESQVSVPSEIIECSFHACSRLHMKIKSMFKLASEARRGHHYWNIVVLLNYLFSMINHELHAYMHLNLREILDESLNRFARDPSCMNLWSEERRSFVFDSTRGFIEELQGGTNYSGDKQTTTGLPSWPSVSPPLKRNREDAGSSDPSRTGLIEGLCKKARQLEVIDLTGIADD